ncbi:MAG TPA: polysaccharide biosynthesis/export family protein [Candidatus Eisenbacteria bacterium]|nr:polysaccharide biosynthesis/export family protein [Candidatus Eisenbacteria bacterium]
MRSQERQRAPWAMVLMFAVCAAACATHHPQPVDSNDVATEPAADAAPEAVAPEPAALLPAAPQSTTEDYRIQAYDELHVRFTYQPELNEQIPVRPDGRISLATTGEIAVIGLTPTELERLVERRSSHRLRKPEVVVVVTKVAEQRAYIGGEVLRPGYVVLQRDMTPLQAVLQSGGFRPTAKLDSVVLMTPGPDGRFTAARMNMDQVVNDGVPERVRLHPGDVVYVPRTWIADANIVVDQYVRGLIPALPRVGVGYSLSQ